MTLGKSLNFQNLRFLQKSMGIKLFSDGCDSCFPPPPSPTKMYQKVSWLPSTPSKVLIRMKKPRDKDGKQYVRLPCPLEVECSRQNNPAKIVASHPF